MTTPTPDPQGAFLAHLRGGFPDWRVGIDYVPDRPSVVVDLVPGGTIDLRRHIDRWRLDLICLGDDPLDMAAQLRSYLWAPFTAAGMRVYAITPEPPYALVDPSTYEMRAYLSLSASLHAVPAA